MIPQWRECSQCSGPCSANSNHSEHTVSPLSGWNWRSTGRSIGSTRAIAGSSNTIECTRPTLTCLCTHLTHTCLCCNTHLFVLIRGAASRKVGLLGPCGKSIYEVGKRWSLCVDDGQGQGRGGIVAPAWLGCASVWGLLWLRAGKKIARY